MSLKIEKCPKCGNKDFKKDHKNFDDSNKIIILCECKKCLHKEEKLIDMDEE